MVDFGGMADKAKEWAGSNPDKADNIVDKAADFLKEKTGQGDQIDKFGEKAKDYLHGSEGQGGEGQPPAGGPPPAEGQQPPPPPQ